MSGTPGLLRDQFVAVEREVHVELAVLQRVRSVRDDPNHADSANPAGDTGPAGNWPMRIMVRGQREPMEPEVDCSRFL